MLGYSTKLSGPPLTTQSALDFNSRKTKALSFNSGQTSNSQFNTQKLPQIGRSISLSSKSAKLKLTTIEANVSTMTQEVHDLRMDTRVLFKNM